MDGEKRKFEAGEALRVIKAARSGTLCVIDDESGPFGAFVNVGSTEQGQPILLLSEMARHTKMLRANPKASLLVTDVMPTDGDPLTGARVTLTGTMRAAENSEWRSLYLTQHPYAELYVDFGDFGFWTLDVARAFLVAGFGRIHAFTADDIFKQA
jgi:heme iron utilization protein